MLPSICIDMQKSLCFLCLAILMISCGSEAKKTNNDALSKAQYVIAISGDHTSMIVGDNITSTWSPADGLVYLGTDKDKKDEPIGTLTMTIGPKISDELNEHLVLTATLSKTDRAVGTADQLNARLFTLVEGTITNVEIGANYIKASLGLKMERVLTYSWDEPESVDVIGTFTALSN